LKTFLASNHHKKPDEEIIPMWKSKTPKEMIEYFVKHMIIQKNIVLRVLQNYTWGYVSNMLIQEQVPLTEEDFKELKSPKDFPMFFDDVLNTLIIDILNKSNNISISHLTVLRGVYAKILLEERSVKDTNTN